MSSGPRLARAAAKVLAEPLETKAPSDAIRRRAVLAMREALEERVRRRKRRRFLYIPAAAALVLAGAGALWSASAHRPHVAAFTAPASAVPPTLRVETMQGTVVQGEQERVAAPDAPVGLGEPVVTKDGFATLALATGTRLDLEHASEVTVSREDTAEIVRLAAGAVTARVAPVKPGARFLVKTDEAEVEVRGTVFRVARLADERCGHVTRVQVTEGHVIVRAGSLEEALGPTDQWTSRCTSPVAARDPAPRLAPKVTPDSPPASELAAQNALFRDAMSAKARGDNRQAVAMIDLMLTRYPQSPLREAALAQRMELLATYDSAAAASAAHGYLAAYPHGFARGDAERLLTDVGHR